MSRTDRSSPIDILLVEDNPGDVRLTREAFNMAGVDVTLEVATNGIEAMEILSRNQTEQSAMPDLVLLDLNLPRMDGFAVLEAINEDPDLARLPIIVLTSSTDREDVTESYGLHANAYLKKPSRPDRFVELVEAVEDFWFERARLPSVA